MPVIETLKRILIQESSTSEEWSQDQHEALMDLLLFGIYVDEKVSVQETNLLDKEIQKLTKETGIDWDAYAAKALRDIHEIHDNPEQRRQFLRHIRERLGDSDKRNRAVQDLKKLLAIDGQVPVEDTFLHEVKALFTMRPVSGKDEEQ